MAKKADARRARKGIDTAAQERLDAFLNELTELTRKHGLVIGGCGCCGSPFIEYSEIRSGSYYTAKLKDSNGECASDIQWN